MVSDAARSSSGTAWQPDATPTRAWQHTLDRWDLMVHGNGFIAYVREETFRGASRVGSTNWAMVTATRPLPDGALTLVATGSLETLTLGACGLPKLLATGPGCSSNLATDFQHPHPPVMELAARYRHAVASRVAVEAYAALAGEPALGPPSYLHRLSAGADPLAPLSRHEMNPAHASAGVLTVAVGSTSWKLEGSFFNGIAPDADRVLPDLGPMKSMAGRFSLNPSRNLAMQASLGRIAGVEGHHAGAGSTVYSVTASAIYHRPLSAHATWATTLGWGRLDDDLLPRASLMLESALAIGDTHTWSGRLEAAERFEGEVTMEGLPDGSHIMSVHSQKRRVAQLSAAYLHSRRLRLAAIGVGVRGSLSILPEELMGLYGQRRAAGFALFVAFRPGGVAAHEVEN